MSPLQRRVYELLNPHQTFAVTCWGAAASHWLSSVLNACAGVYCTHSHQSVWRLFADLTPVSSLRYLQIVSMLGRAEGAIVAGDVHGVPPYDIAELESFFGARFRSAALVRDPRPRLMSCYALQLWTTDLAAVSEHVNRTFPAEILSLAPSGSPEECLFIQCANLLNTIIYEKNLRTFRMEDLTTNDADVLGELAGAASYPRTSSAPDRDWAERALATPALLRHNRTDRAYEPWQLRVVNAVLSSEATSLYQELGYDLSWLG